MSHLQPLIALFQIILLRYPLAVGAYILEILPLLYFPLHSGNRQVQVSLRALPAVEFDVAKVASFAERAIPRLAHPLNNTFHVKIMTARGAEVGFFIKTNHTFNIIVIQPHGCCQHSLLLDPFGTIWRCGFIFADNFFRNYLSLLLLLLAFLPNTEDSCRYYCNADEHSHHDQHDLQYKLLPRTTVILAAFLQRIGSEDWKVSGCKPTTGIAALFPKRIAKTQG